MSQPARCDTSNTSSGSMVRIGTVLCFPARSLILIIGLALLVVTLIALSPPLLWAYNIDRAARALTQGTQWPSPRRADSLPEQRDEEALRSALAHLAAAAKWAPTDPYAHRLAAQVYAAREEWTVAAAEAERAATLAPSDPIIAWEMALVYEQLAEAVLSAPRDNILPELISAPITAPDQPIDTVYCRDGGPRTCYVDLDRYTQPFAAMPDGPELTADVLFMHPPAGVTLMKHIPAGAPALVFLMGLDPGVRTGGTDGATYEVWVTPSGSSARLVFQQTLDAVEARRGWLPAVVDLSAWAGQLVTLELRTGGGPAGNTVDDWYAWGDVAFTESQAARFMQQLPRERMLRAWQAAGLDAGKAVAYGDEASRLSQYDHAVAWYNRALQLEPAQPFDFLYRRAITAINSGSESAEEYLAAAYALDPSATPVEVSSQSSVQINGSDLRWMTPIADAVTYGTALSARSDPNATAGYMWWQGQATTVVRVAHEGEYNLTFRVVHSTPPPIKLAVGVDGQPGTSFELARGDASRDVLALPVHLKAGLHTVNIWYLNDGMVGGEDRNAVIEKVIVEEN